MAGKFQLRTRGWDAFTIVGIVLLAVVGFGGLFLLRDRFSPTGTPALLFLVAFGVVTFLLFAGPGFVYTLRKRVGVLKRRLPGSTMGWIRSHLYLPYLAVAAAFVHAALAPFQGDLSSGKVLLALGLLLLVSGLCRHHIIGVQKEALNLNISIGKLAEGQPRAFRLLVTDLTEGRRPVQELDAQAAQLDQAQQQRWREIRSLYDRVQRHFPAEGGQTAGVRQYKVWKVLHPPLTVIFFALLAYHVFDTLGGTKAIFENDKEQFASSSQCAGCHSDTYSEWARSSMAHAQSSSIMIGQLPVTIQENQRLAAARGAGQQQLFDSVAKSCINCHAQLGARFAEDIAALLPLGAENSAKGGGVAVEGGGAAMQEDGVGCVVCHTQGAVLPERAGFAEMPVTAGGASNYGTQYGPLFANPDPLPTRVHGMEQGDRGIWNDPLTSSQLCGSCHNVKADIDGDGVNPGNVSEDFAVPAQQGDGDRDFQLDQNELDNQDGTLDDLILQTTYDEWQDYVVAFDARTKADPRNRLQRPLGCVQCHMPTEGDGTRGVVDQGPGVMPVPERPHRSHSFVGVDYELDVSKYESKEARDLALAERKALLGSAVTVEVVKGQVSRGQLSAEVRMQNNLLGHAFPTGFAFARQLWLEVSARTTSGAEVCLVPPANGVSTPCASGKIDRPVDDLRQCDPTSVQRAIGQRLRIAPDKVGNANVRFAAAFPADSCDPWLTNFQKILTDGDANGDGVFEEVPYQSFLSDIVKIRTRVATQQAMNPLEPVRLQPDGRGRLVDASANAFPYTFDVRNVPRGEDVVVTAKLRFRHLPPDFVRGLEQRTQGRSDIPEKARIDADKLLEGMVVTDVVEASSGQGPQLACKGPQNEEGASILSCVEQVQEQAADDDEPDRGDPEVLVPTGVAAALLLTVAVATAVVGAGARRRRRV